MESEFEKLRLELLSASAHNQYAVKRVLAKLLLRPWGVVDIMTTGAVSRSTEET